MPKTNEKGTPEYNYGYGTKADKKWYIAASLWSAGIFIFICLFVSALVWLFPTDTGSLGKDILNGFLIFAIFFVVVMVLFNIPSSSRRKKTKKLKKSGKKNGR
jgi:hypothetical protein